MAAEPVAEPTPRTTRRRRVVLGVLVVALAASVGGVVGSARIKSPQQQIADATGPGATLLTAPVEFRALGAGLTVNGQVTATSSVDVSPTPGQEEGSSGLVTALPKPAGARVEAGEVIAEIDGRPVIALPGKVPNYRNLLPGSHGRDVAELQRALRAVGDDPGSTNGVYGEGTKRAVTRLYDRLGYEPVAAGDPAEIRGLAVAVRTAERALSAAKTTLATTPATSPERAAAEVTETRAAEDLTQARRDLAQAQKADAPADQIHQLRLAVRAAERALEDARAAVAALPRTSAERQAAQVAVDYAREDVKTARADLAQAQATSGPMLPSSEIVFLPYLPARVVSVKGTVGGKLGTDPLLTIVGGKLVVDVEAQESDLDAISEGSLAEVSVDSNPAVPGRVTSIGAVQVSETGQRVALVRVVSDEPLPQSSYDKVVRVVIKPQGTVAKTLVVPLAAVFADSDANAFVAVVRGGVKTRVEVTVGQILGGYASVTPPRDGLKAGDQVVVGTVAENAPRDTAPDAGDG